MAAILSKALCYIAVILLGVLLRRVGFFKKEDFHLLSRIVINITLPAAVVVSLSGRELDPAMLAITLMGLGFGCLYLALGWLTHLRRSKEDRAFAVQNLAGYNIGNFALPFTQSFLGPAGVMVTGLFDAGNSFICLGGAYCAASAVKGSKGVSPLAILKTLLHSVPFDTYVTMIVLGLLRLELPQGLLSFAGVIANANVFLSMLMIGVGFQLSGDRSQLGAILRILLTRYGVALLLALGCFFLLPFSLETRQALAILVFSPITSVAPSFTARLKGDFGLASAVNSLSILISICCIVIVMLLVL